MIGGAQVAIGMAFDARGLVLQSFCASHKKHGVGEETEDFKTQDARLGKMISGLAVGEGWW